MKITPLSVLCEREPEGRESEGAPTPGATPTQPHYFITTRKWQALSMDRPRTLLAPVVLAL